MMVYIALYHFGYKFDIHVLHLGVGVCYMMIGRVLRSILLFIDILRRRLLSALLQPTLFFPPICHTI